jgi:hypothetical protein
MIDFYLLEKEKRIIELFLKNSNKNTPEREYFYYGSYISISTISSLILLFAKSALSFTS